ncbi:unnamed protein product [Prorocentrum cordatum]|uniref:RanBP2-type domain-containing protein n=1 Tax=Prorocentrum cordatum TaxID=2364126 RepID=A0ABN9PXE5_9DINO|nr:unnamed protein product [Polarella glacialis]
MAGGTWSWNTNEGSRRDPAGSENWKCAQPECGCGKNRSWFTWCKHCRRPGYEVVGGKLGDHPCEAGGGRKNRQRGGGGGMALALMGGAGMPPDITIEEIDAVLAMATKFGDEGAKSQHQVWRKQKLDATKVPVEKPLERQANEAPQQFRILEKRLNR